jgi:hypothetical protein
MFFIDLNQFIVSQTYGILGCPYIARRCCEKTYENKKGGFLRLSKYKLSFLEFHEFH